MEGGRSCRTSRRVVVNVAVVVAAALSFRCLSSKVNKPEVPAGGTLWNQACSRIAHRMELDLISRFLGKRVVSSPGIMTSADNNDGRKCCDSVKAEKKAVWQWIYCRGSCFVGSTAPFVLRRNVDG